MITVHNLYEEHGLFTYSAGDSLGKECNAPKRDSGIYVIYRERVTESSLIYIGISGREGSGGEIIHRKNGLGGRIVNGKQFIENRRKSWPRKMKEDGITTIIVKWWITYGQQATDFPRPIEIGLLEEFEGKYNRLPVWNKKIRA